MRQHLFIYHLALFALVTTCAVDKGAGDELSVPRGIQQKQLHFYKYSLRENHTCVQTCTFPLLHMAQQRTTGK